MSDHKPHGVINQSALGRKDDHLYRVAVKALIINDSNEVLIVKESGRSFWDIPGGGMDHDEDIYTALQRELHEEVGLVGSFTYKPIAIDDPVHLEMSNVMQIRLIFAVYPENMTFSVGIDADEVKYVQPDAFKDSGIAAEHEIFEYAQIVLADRGQHD